jgi:hypothetical protein
MPEFRDVKEEKRQKVCKDICGYKKYHEGPL